MCYLSCTAGLVEFGCPSNVRPRNQRRRRSCGENSHAQATSPVGTFEVVSSGERHNRALGTADESTCWTQNAAFGLYGPFDDGVAAGDLQIPQCRRLPHLRQPSRQHDLMLERPRAPEMNTRTVVFLFGYSALIGGSGSAI